jgi:hypothetical protein
LRIPKTVQPAGLRTWSAPAIEEVSVQIELEDPARGRIANPDKPFVIGRFNKFVIAADQLDILFIGTLSLHPGGSSIVSEYLLRGLVG